MGTNYKLLGIGVIFRFLYKTVFCFQFLGKLVCSWIRSRLRNYLLARTHDLLLRKCWKLDFLASEWLGVFSKYISWAVSRFSRGPVARNHRQHVFRSNSYFTQLDRKSDDGAFLPLGSWRSWKQLWRDLVGHSEARKTNFQYFRGKRSCGRTENVLFQRTANPTASELAFQELLTRWEYHE